MSRADYLARTGRDHAHPGGRWHRVLRTLAEGPISFGDLFRATDPGVYDAPLERTKLLRALRDLAALGLVERIDAWGWVNTAAGGETLARLDAEEGPQCAAA